MMKKVLLLLAILPTIVFAQDIIVTSSGESMKVYVTDISATSVYYKLTNADTAALHTIAKSDILVIKKEDGTIINMVESASQPDQPNATENQPDRFPIVDLSQYHGYLLQKGNCVYIPTDSKIDYERAGQEEIKKLMDERGCWQVVDKPEQAHFVAMFTVSTTGRDMARLYFRARTKYENQPSIYASSSYITNVASDIYAMGYSTGESINENITAANQIISYLFDYFLPRFASIETYRKFMGYGKNSSTTQALNEDWYLP